MFTDSFMFVYRGYDFDDNVPMGHSPRQSYGQINGLDIITASSPKAKATEPSAVTQSEHKENLSDQSPIIDVSVWNMDEDEEDLEDIGNEARLGTTAINSSGTGPIKDTADLFSISSPAPSPTTNAKPDATNNPNVSQSPSSWVCFEEYNPAYDSEKNKGKFDKFKQNKKVVYSGSNENNNNTTTKGSSNNNNNKESEEYSGYDDNEDSSESVSVRHRDQEDTCNIDILNDCVVM